MMAVRLVDAENKTLPVSSVFAAFSRVKKHELVPVIVKKREPIPRIVKDVNYCPEL
jgi:hypothetical protein